MSDKNIKNKVVGGLAWSFFERISTQLVSTLVTVVLARLLAPEHYGIISIVTVFITFLNVFITSGFGSALVQKKDADLLDFDTAFVLSLGLSAVLYIVLFLAAPAIAVFYEMPLLTDVLRVMGLQLPLAAVTNIQRSHVQRAMTFKKFFLVTLGGTIISGLSGVIMAAAGFGVWALVAQYMSNTIATTVLLFSVCTWRPKFRFSSQKAKEIGSFGWKVLATQLIATLESDIRSLLIGKVFGSADLAYYDHGKRYPALLVTNINSSIDSVMLSAYSKEQEDLQRILAMLRRSVCVGCYALVPVLLGFAAVSDMFVHLLLTDKWLPAVPFLQIFCLVYLTRPMESSCRQALLAIGKSGVVLAVITTINVVALLGTIVAVFIIKNVLAIALVSLLTTLVSLIGFTSCTGHFLKYTFKMQMQDLLPPIIMGGIMCAVVVFVGQLQIPALLLLLLQILIGVVIYLGLSFLFKVEAFTYLLGMIKSKLKKQR